MSGASLSLSLGMYVMDVWRGRIFFGVSAAAGIVVALYFYRNDVERERAKSIVLPAAVIDTPAPRHHLPKSQANPYLVAFCDPSLDLAKRIPNDLSSNLFSLQTPEEVKLVINVLRNSKEPDAVRNHAANLLRNSDNLSVLGILITILNDHSETTRMRAFAIQHLDSLMESSSEKPLQVTSNLETLLGSDVHELRAQAFQTLLRIRNPVAEALRQRILSRAVQDDAFLVISLNSIAERQEYIFLPQVRAFLTSPRASVQIASISALGLLRDVQSKPALFALRDAEDPNVRSAVKVAINSVESAPASALGREPTQASDATIRPDF